MRVVVVYDRDGVVLVGVFGEVIQCVQYIYFGVRVLNLCSVKIDLEIVI